MTYIAFFSLQKDALLMMTWMRKNPDQPLFVGFLLPTPAKSRPKELRSFSQSEALTPRFALQETCGASSAINSRRTTRVTSERANLSMTSDSCKIKDSLNMGIEAQWSDLRIILDVATAKDISYYKCTKLK